MGYKNNIPDTIKIFVNNIYHIQKKKVCMELELDCVNFSIYYFKF